MLFVINLLFHVKQETKQESKKNKNKNNIWAIIGHENLPYVVYLIKFFLEVGLFRGFVWLGENKFLKM